MFLVYFLVWVIFNGRLTLEVAAFGVVIASVIFAFTCRFMDYSFKKEKKFWLNLFRLIAFGIRLINEVIRANLKVAHLILSEEEEIQPVLLHFESPVETNLGRTLLANSITLTPGTITVEMDDRGYTVHCLDEELAVGVNDSEFVDRIQEMEEAMR